MIFRAEIVSVKDKTVSRKVVSEELEDKPYEQLYEYKIRIPLIHGNSSITTDDNLPYATYVPFPGTETTKLNKGMIVYVSSVDMEEGEYIILGVIPLKTRSSNLYSSIELLDKLSTNEKSTIDLRCDTLNIYTDKESKVEKDNMQALVGWKNGKIKDYTWPISNGGTGISITDKDTADSKYAKGKKLCDNFNLTKINVISVSDFDKLSSNNKLEDNTLYFTYYDEEDL